MLNSVSNKSSDNIVRSSVALLLLASGAIAVKYSSRVLKENY